MSTSSKRGVAATALIATAAMVVTSCNSNSAEPESDGPASLRMVVWTSNEEHLALLNSIADEYMETTDAVDEITFESVTVDTLNTVLTTQLASNDPPDLSWLPIESSQDFIDAGALVDVEDALKARDDYAFDDLIPELQERWRTSEGQFGVPFSTGPFIMYYNADLYEAAGVPNPHQMIAAGTWDWEHFREASRAITESQGVPGYTINDFEYQNWTRLVPLMYAYNSSPWDTDASSCTMDSPGMQDAMELLHGMIYEDRSIPLPGQQSNFWGGQAGATSAFPSSTTLLSDATFEWDIAPMPAGPAGSAQVVGQAAVTAYADGENTDAAVDFLGFLTNPENSAKMAVFWPPARESQRTAEVMTHSTPLAPEQLAPILEKDSELLPVTTDSAAVNDVLNSTLEESLFSADGDVEDALSTVCQGISPLLQD